MLVLDEFGYVPFDVDGARLLYQVISDSYEEEGIVFTTNVEFSRWGTVFADDKLAAAMRGPGGPPRKARRVQGPEPPARSPSCWASQEYRGVPAPVPKTFVAKPERKGALLRSGA